MHINWGLWIMPQPLERLPWTTFRKKFDDPARAFSEPISQPMIDHHRPTGSNSTPNPDSNKLLRRPSWVHPTLITESPATHRAPHRNWFPCKLSCSFKVPSKNDSLTIPTRLAFYAKGNHQLHSSLSPPSSARPSIVRPFVFRDNLNINAEAFWAPKAKKSISDDRLECARAKTKPTPNRAHSQIIAATSPKRAESKKSK